MHVIATAGHVDHGKSTLVRALTGQDPDRLDEEHRRGLSIELGYCWMSLPDVGDVAFVDVPGHERFVSTMLAGVGPVPAVLFVVAADDPWMPQAAEHLAALDALGVRHGVVAVTRSDLTDPAPAMARAGQHLAETSLRGAPLVAVSARDGTGLNELRRTIAALVRRLPTPSSDAAVRFWVDRSFRISGAGTVVTGTLAAGHIEVGDELALDGVLVRVRGIEMLSRPADIAHGVARVALRLGGGAPEDLRRGSVLVTPGRWHHTDVVDVRVDGPEPLPERPLLHIGAASRGVRCRLLGESLHRLRLSNALPLRVGDRLILRDPGSRRLLGATVLDPDPPALDRRGAAGRRTSALAATTGVPDLADELRRRRVARASSLRRYGVDIDETAEEVAVAARGWLLDRREVPRLRQAIQRLVDDRIRSHPLDPGLPLAAAARRLGLPTPDLVAPILPPPLEVVEGRVVDPRATLPGPLLQALEQLEAELAEQPFAAPDVTRLATLGLDSRAIAAAGRAGRLLRLADTVVLLPGADRAAARLLHELPQPFTTSQARVRLGTSRRVVLPLLQLLDERRLTRRLVDDRREVVPAEGVLPAEGAEGDAGNSRPDSGYS
ncbi:MAG: selenocysteine-specific elongation factor [Nocardioidaceae bacterium]|nr:selenocysteine-specific elongation factor [Nocardioidaceae bacterium]